MIFSIVFIAVVMLIVVVVTIIANYILKNQDNVVGNRKGDGILLSNLQNTNCSIREADEYMRLTNSVDSIVNVDVKDISSDERKCL